MAYFVIFGSFIAMFIWLPKAMKDAVVCDEKAKITAIGVCDEDARCNVIAVDSDGESQTVVRFSPILGNTTTTCKGKR